MNKLINGYKITKDFNTRGAGMSRWGLAEKNGEKFFIKELLQPKFPEDGSFSEEYLEYARKNCIDFYRKRKRYYDALSQCRTGNIVIVEDFFRFDTKYYIITRFVDAVNVTAKELAGLETRNKEVLLNVVANSIAALHRHGLVHSDLKLDNILVKKTAAGSYTAKIIDFDSGFMVSEPPSNEEEIVGDDVYYAPETIRQLLGEDVSLTEKIDIFALGIIFHQIWTGELPAFNSEYANVAETVLNGAVMQIDYSIPKKLRELIKCMLSENPADRPSADEIFDTLMGKEESSVFKTKLELESLDNLWNSPVLYPHITKKPQDTID